MEFKNTDFACFFGFWPTLRNLKLCIHRCVFEYTVGLNKLLQGSMSEYTVCLNKLLQGSMFQYTVCLNKLLQGSMSE